jgi:hypothetical protein
VHSFVPAARRPEDSGLTMYENSRNRAGIGSFGGSATPVFDALIAEFRASFRTVPGDPWSPIPVPRFSELSASGDRFRLPPGPSGL